MDWNGLATMLATKRPHEKECGEGVPVRAKLFNFVVNDFNAREFLRFNRTRRTQSIFIHTEVCVQDVQILGVFSSDKCEQYLKKNIPVFIQFHGTEMCLLESPLQEHKLWMWFCFGYWCTSAKRQNSLCSIAHVVGKAIRIQLDLYCTFEDGKLIGLYRTASRIITLLCGEMPLRLNTTETWLEFKFLRPLCLWVQKVQTNSFAHGFAHGLTTSSLNLHS